MAEKYSTNCEADHTLEIKPTTNIDSIEENKKNVTLIWFNPLTDENHDAEKIKEDLQAVNHFIRCVTDIHSCTTYIQSNKTEKIFLILSGMNVYKLPLDTINLFQLDSIFVFPEIPHDFKRLYEDFPKVVDICDNPNDLIMSIKESIKNVNRQIEVVSFYDKRQQDTRDLSEQSPEFLWFQLFKDVIEHLPRDDRAKEEMLTACRQYYRDNRRILKDINEFAENYHIDDCIRWYTKNTFIYKMINTALRTEDIEQLYIFRYYIADLSKQLAKKYEEMKNGVEKKIYLYRGTVMNTSEAEKFRGIIGKLIAVNGYWSTSRDRSYALTFAKKAMFHSETIAVLYEIECDIYDENESVIFADISDISDFPEEQEVLFDAGSIFQIQNTKKEDELYTIQIKTTSVGQELGKQYIQQNRIQLEKEGPRIMLSILLKRMGKFQRSLQLLHYLRENPDGENIAYIHNRIGIALKDQGKYEDALEYLKEAFKLTFYSNPPDKTYSAYVLHNHGLVYAKQNNFKNAWDYYRRAVQMLRDEGEDNGSGIALFYNSMGRVYLYQRNFDKAFEYQFEALEIRERIMPNHVMNAFSYADIANIYFTQENYNEALIYHLKALELRQKFLPSNNYNTAGSLHEIGKTYHKMNEMSMALKYYQQSLQIYKEYVNTNLYYNVAQILEDIASTYDNDSQQALDYRLEALKFWRNVQAINHSCLLRLLDTIAFTYKSMGKIEDSLKFYEEALTIQKKYFRRDKYNVVRLLESIASIYKLMDRTRDSHNFYQKALRIRNQCS